MAVKHDPAGIMLDHLDAEANGVRDFSHFRNNSQEGGHQRQPRPERSALLWQ